VSPEIVIRAPSVDALFDQWDPARREPPRAGQRRPRAHLVLPPEVERADAAMATETFRGTRC